MGIYPTILLSTVLFWDYAQNIVAILVSCLLLAWLMAWESHISNDESPTLEEIIEIHGQNLLNQEITVDSDEEEYVDHFVEETTEQRNQRHLRQASEDLRDEEQLKREQKQAEEEAEAEEEEEEEEAEEKEEKEEGKNEEREKRKKPRKRLRKKRSREDDYDYVPITVLESETPEENARLACFPFYANY